MDVDCYQMCYQCPIAVMGEMAYTGKKLCTKGWNAEEIENEVDNGTS